MAMLGIGSQDKRSFEYEIVFSAAQRFKTT